MAAVLPSRNEPATVAGVAAAVDEAIHPRRGRIVNVDASADDATSMAFREAATKAPRLSVTRSQPGKGLQVLAGLEFTSFADCVLVADTDTRTPSPATYRALVTAVLAGADLAIADYRRRWYEANLTNHVARPLIAAATGLDLPQPLAGDFALSASAVRTLLRAHGALPASGMRDAVDGYGIDAFVVRAVAEGGGQVCSTRFDTAKSHAPSFPHLKPIFDDAVPILLAPAVTRPAHLPGRPAFRLEPYELPSRVLADMLDRLDAMRATAGAGQTGARWSEVLSTAWQRARLDTAEAASELWPHYLDRVRDYLRLAQNVGPHVAEHFLAAAMDAFLGHAASLDRQQRSRSPSHPSQEGR